MEDTLRYSRYFPKESNQSLLAVVETMKWQKSLGVLAKLALLGSDIAPPAEILLISSHPSSNG